MPMSKKVNGVWETGKQYFVKQNGAWKEAVEGYVKQGGVWQKVWPEGPSFPNTPNQWRRLAYDYGNMTSNFPGISPNMSLGWLPCYPRIKGVQASDFHPYAADHPSFQNNDQRPFYFDWAYPPGQAPDISRLVEVILFHSDGSVWGRYKPTDFIPATNANGMKGYLIPYPSDTMIVDPDPNHALENEVATYYTQSDPNAYTIWYFN